MRNQSGYIDLRDLKIQGTQNDTGESVALLSGKARGTFGPSLTVMNQKGEIGTVPMAEIALNEESKTKLLKRLASTPLPTISSSPAAYQRRF